MRQLKEIESDLNLAVSQLNQLCVSEHFCDSDVISLAPKYAMNVRKLQREYDSSGAKNIKVNEAVQC